MQNVILMTDQELTTLIKEAVRSEIQSLKPEEPKKPDADELIDIDEVCRILKISKTTVFEMRKRGELSFNRVKGTRIVRYKKSDVFAALKKINQKFD